MKKILFSIGVIVALTFMLVSAYCSETDAGDDPLNFGITNYYDNYTNVTRADHCFIPGVGIVSECIGAGGNCKLKEWYCSSTQTLKSRVYTVTHCLNGEAV